MSKPGLLIFCSQAAVSVEMRSDLTETFRVCTAKSLPQAISILSEHHARILLTDYPFGFEVDISHADVHLLDCFLDVDRYVKVVVVVPAKARQLGLRFLERGAHAFLTSPLDADHLRIVLERAWYLHDLEDLCFNGDAGQRNDSIVHAAKPRYQELGLVAARKRLERSLIRWALTRHAGNRTRAAADLKISRSTLYDLMAKLSLDFRVTRTS